EKNIKGFKSHHLYLHVAIITVVSYVMSFQANFYLAAITIGFSHLLLDGFKRNLGKLKRLQKHLFFIDQLMHIAMIVIVCLVHEEMYGITPIFEIPFKDKTIAIITGYIICMKPSNIIIRALFETYNIKISDEGLDRSNEIANAGQVIGSIERLLTFSLVLIGQFHAVGFLIAAKSIIRYKEADRPKTEYVLIGTLLSFGIAILLGILCLKYDALVV
ncbi:MAG: DUF3307 domain-containing protein, partial [Bacteroidales bacterium]|nr:DUF3307 domain-containing protein [Bacteroidales bacterium]